MGWTVLVCGDPYRADDGAAPAAADRLTDVLSARADVSVRRVGQLEPDDLVAATTSGSCLVLDAVRGVPPGTLVRMPLAAIGDATGPAAASTHALLLPTVVDLAEALGARLERATFIGIGGERFSMGSGLSPSVAAGLDAYVLAIAEHIDAAEGARCA